MSYSFFIAHLLRPSATKSVEDKIFRKFGHLVKIRPKIFSTKIFFRVLFCLGTFLVQFFTLIPKIAVSLQLPRKKVMSDLLQLLLRLLQLLSLITFFLGTFMRRDIDIRNHREKLDQKSTNTKQNSKKNFGRKNLGQFIYHPTKI